MIMSPGVCQVFGGNVLTYDGLHYEKMSDCVQVLTQDCSEEKKFRVSITESRDVSCLINIVIMRVSCLGLWVAFIISS